MAAALDIGVDGVAHLPGPVFVVADEDDAVVAVEKLGLEMQFVLAGEIDRVACPLGPAEEMAVVARPAGRGVFLGMAGGVGPFHMRIARRGQRRQRDLQRHAWRLRRQPHEAAGERALDADGRARTGRAWAR